MSHHSLSQTLSVAIKAPETVEMGLSDRGELASDVNENAIKVTLRSAV